jgi:hypothetical protein
MNTVINLYNLSYEKIFEIDWKKAVCLFMSGKATSYSTEEYIDIKTASGIFKLPKDMVLKKYVYIPYREFSPSRRNILRRDNYTCQYCSCYMEKNQCTVDHVVPRSRGGKHEWANVVTCCLRCNRKKSDRTPDEAKMPLLSIPKPLKF